MAQGDGEAPVAPAGGGGLPFAVAADVALKVCTKYDTIFLDGWMDE
jgi:hypothetical protein